jgi:hypothetical protein
MSNYAAMDLKLQDAIAQIESGQIQLPEFQRNFNWSRADQRGLLASIQKEYPVGTLLLLKTSEIPNDQNPFGLRKFEGAPDPTKEVSYLVLDGQQRLTSCFQSFYGSGKKWFCINLETLFKAHTKNPHGDLEFEDFIESVVPEPAHPENLLYSRSLLPFMMIRSRKEMRNHLSKFRSNLLEKEETKAFGEFVDTELEGYLDIFFDYQFPAVVLPAELDLEAVANIFTKINTQGLRLSAFDLCVAALFPSGINLRTKWADAKSDGDVRQLDSDGTATLQSIALLAGVQSKKAGLVRQLRAGAVADNWDSAINAMKLSAGLLRGIGVHSSKTLPYDAVIPALVAAVAKAPSPVKPPDVAARTIQLRRWVMQTAYQQRYTEGIDSKRQDDFQLVSQWFAGGELPEFLNSPVLWSDESYNIGRSGARASAFLALLNSNQPHDWIKEHEILGLDIDGCVKAELHHIFPKAYLAKSGYAPKQIERLFNFTYLSKESNNFISDRKPSVYLAELFQTVQDNAGVTADLAQQAVRELFRPHLIDGNAFDAMLNDDFDGFTQARGAALLLKLESWGVPVTVAPNAELDEELEAESVDD